MKEPDMKKADNYFYPELPPELKSNWHITETLITSGHSQIYKIVNDEASATASNTEATRILQITSKTDFNKKIYKKAISIKSPYIQQLLEIIEYKHNYYILTRYYHSLKEIICHEGITTEDILKIAHDISAALELLHSKKILHLDCTPSNIYLDKDGSYCLGDFSSAIFYNSKSKPLTSTTPGYIPPEISKKGIPCITSDVYIFSCLLYTLFNNGYTVTDNHPDGSIKDNIPQELYQIILKGCSKNPSGRFSSIGEMKSLLSSPEITEKLSNNNYYLNITDLMHPLYYLKTPLITSGPAINRKHPVKPYILCCILILLTGTLFLFSSYNYFNKNNIYQTKQKEATAINNSIATDTPLSGMLPSGTSGKNNINKNNIQDNKARTNKTIKKSKTIKTPGTVKLTKTETDISNKNITSLPNPQNPGFFCSKLTVLYANNNKIVNLNNIKHYSSLKELYLAGNLISDLSPLEEIPDIKILVLSYNKITDLSPVSYLKSLTNLDISGNNNMYNFSQLGSLHNLKTLNATNTNITKEEIKFLSAYLPDCEIFY